MNALQKVNGLRPAEPGIPKTQSNRSFIHLREPKKLYSFKVNLQRGPIWLANLMPPKLRYCFIVTKFKI